MESNGVVDNVLIEIGDLAISSPVKLPDEIINSDVVLHNKPPFGYAASLQRYDDAKNVYQWFSQKHGSPYWNAYGSPMVLVPRDEE